MHNLKWVRSGFCESGTCVEVAFGDLVHVRDARRGPSFAVDRNAWQTFVAWVRGGEGGNFAPGCAS